MFSEIGEIALVAARLGQFLQFLKTRVILILNFTRPHAITHTNLREFCRKLLSLNQSVVFSLFKRLILLIAIVRQGSIAELLKQQGRTYYSRTRNYLSVEYKCARASFVLLETETNGLTLDASVSFTLATCAECTGNVGFLSYRMKTKVQLSARVYELESKITL